MQRTDRLRMVFVLLLSLIGTAALFLPFTSDTSPLRALVAAVTPGAFPFRLIFLAVPFFLSIAILAYQARSLMVDRIPDAEIAIAYALSIVAMLSVLGFIAPLAFADYVISRHETISIVVAIAFVGTNLLVLLRNRRAELPRDATAEAFLLGGYLPNSAFCLAAFYPDGLFSGWNIGAYLIAVVSLGYLAAIVLLSRRRPNGTSDAVEIPRTQVARS